MFELNSIYRVQEFLSDPFVILEMDRDLLSTNASAMLLNRGENKVCDAYEFELVNKCRISFIAQFYALSNVRTGSKCLTCLC